MALILIVQQLVRRKRSYESDQECRQDFKRRKVGHYFTESIQQMWSSPRESDDKMELSLGSSPIEHVKDVRDDQSENLVSSLESKSSVRRLPSNIPSTDKLEVELSIKSNDEMAETGTDSLSHPNSLKTPISRMNATESHLGSPNAAAVTGSSKSFGLAFSSLTISRGETRYTMAQIPPSRATTLELLSRRGIKPVLYRDPFYSDIKDKCKPMTYAGVEFQIPVLGDLKLQRIQLSSCNLPTNEYRTPGQFCDRFIFFEFFTETFRTWTVPMIPPPRRKIEENLRKKSPKKITGTSGSAGVSQVKDPTQAHKFGQKYMLLKTEKSSTDNLVLMSIEIHVNTRGTLNPDPKTDRVEAVVYCLRHFEPLLYKRNGREFEETHCGVLVIDSWNEFSASGIGGYPVHQVSDELELFKSLVNKVHSFDPDFLVGYEIQSASWGYIVQRMEIISPKFDFLARVSRVEKADAVTKFGSENKYGHEHSTSLVTSGRIFCNVWRYAVFSSPNLLSVE